MGRVVFLTILGIVFSSLLVSGAFYPRDYCIPLANANVCAIWNGSIYVWHNVTVNGTVGGAGDGNNYPISIDITGTSTKIVNIVRSGLTNINASFTDNSDNTSWNKTYADTLYAPISVTGDNTSWNQSHANTLYYGIGNPSGYISSYTETDPFYNRSWNQSKADSLYYSIDNPSAFITQTRLIMPSGIWVLTNNTAFQINAGTGISISNDTRGNVTITNTVTDTNSGGTLLRITRPNASIVIVQNSTDVNVSVNVTYLDAFFVGQSEYANLDTDGTNDVLTSSNHVNASGDVNVTGAYNALHLQLGTDVVGDLELNTSQVTLNDLTNDAGYLSSALLRITRPNASIIIVQNSTDANISVNVTYLDAFFVGQSEYANLDTDSTNDLTTSTLFLNASSSEANITGTYNALVINITESKLDCIAITGSAALCDGNDASGGAGDALLRINSPNASIVIVQNTSDANITVNVTYLDTFFVGQSEYANLDTDSTNDLTTTSVFANASSSEANVTGTYGALVINITESKLDCIAITGSAALCDGDDASGGAGDALLRVNSPNASIVVVQNSSDANITVNVTYLDGFFYLDSNPSSYITDGNTGWDNSYNFIANGTDAALRFVNATNNVTTANLTVTHFLRAGSVNFTTLQISENTNLYFTDSRAALAVQNTTILRNSTDVALRFVNATNNVTTANLTVTHFLRAGSVNFTTTQISEGNNLYYTDSRAALAVQNVSILRNWTNVNFTKLVVSTLTAASCDLKATTNGTVYCGTDASGGEFQNGSDITVAELYISAPPVECAGDNYFMTYFEGNKSTCRPINTSALGITGGSSFINRTNVSASSGNTTYENATNVSQLRIPVFAGLNYSISCELQFSTASATTGMRLGVKMPAMNRVQTYLSLMGGPANSIENTTNSTTPVVSWTDSLNVDNPGRIKMLAQPSATGEIVPVVFSEAANANVTVNVGAWCETNIITGGIPN